MRLWGNVGLWWRVRAVSDGWRDDIPIEGDLGGQMEKGAKRGAPMKQ